MFIATPTAHVGALARGAGPISTLTTPYTYAASCTEIFAVTEITYADATETVIISDVSDTRFGACQPTGFTEVDITSRFTYSPAVCPESWTAYSLSTTDSSVSTAWCCNSGYTLYSATDWPIDWATQPCVKVIEEATTVSETIMSSGTAVHAPWHISWKASDTTTLWPVPPAWGAGSAECIATWTPGGATVYATTTTTTTTQGQGLSTSTENGNSWATTTTTEAAGGSGGTSVAGVDDNGNGVNGLDTNSTLFWFLVIGLPVLGTLALALCCMAYYYRRAQKRARRRRRRRARRIKVVET